MGFDSAKDAISARLRIKQPGPGYIHFPSEMDEPYEDELGCTCGQASLAKARQLPAGEQPSDRCRADAAPAVNSWLARLEVEDHLRLDRTPLAC